MKSKTEGMTDREILKKLYDIGYAEGQSLKVPADNKTFPMVFDQALTELQAYYKEKIIAVLPYGSDMKCRECTKAVLKAINNGR